MKDIIPDERVPEHRDGAAARRSSPTFAYIGLIGFCLFLAKGLLWLTLPLMLAFGEGWGWLE